MALSNLIGRRTHHDLTDAVHKLAEKTAGRQFTASIYHIFRQGFD